LISAVSAMTEVGSPGLDHVLDQAADLAGGRVGDLLSALDEDGMAHAGDLQERHNVKFLGISR
jgi:hypothetical protein